MIPNPTLSRGTGGQAEDQKENNSPTSLKKKHSWLFCINALRVGSCLLPQPFSCWQGSVGGFVVAAWAVTHQESRTKLQHLIISIPVALTARPCGSCPEIPNMPLSQGVNILLSSSWLQNSRSDLLVARGSGIPARSTEILLHPLGRAANPHLSAWELILP